MTDQQQQQMQVSVYRNVYREREGRSDKRWWTVLVKDGAFVTMEHFDGQVVDGLDQAQQRALARQDEYLATDTRSAS